MELGCERARSRHQGVKEAVDEVAWHGVACDGGGLTCRVGAWTGCHVVDCARFGWCSVVEGSK